MTKADVERLIAYNEAERKADGPFEFLKVAVANPNLGNWLKMKVLWQAHENCGLTERCREYARAFRATGLESDAGMAFRNFCTSSGKIRR